MHGRDGFTCGLFGFSLLILLMPTIGAANEAGKKLAQQGGEGVQACSSCHGAQGGGNAAAGWPRLAGLNADYMAQQLTAMANGTRSNPIMAPIASALSEQQRGDVAEYFASLKPPTMAPGGEVDQKTLHRGETLAQRGDWQQGIPACTSCHGLQGQGVGVAFPSIAGQPAMYLQNQIKAWQSGSRHNDPNGLMASVAKRLSDEDSQAVTAWFASLPAKPSNNDQ
ncbi:c-type cytochrome [Marinobacter sediminum]|uniref:c-type cytochrome n=1 Tax=Marinobacter sediminum TaxID=256323 RepID=UPI00202FDF6C|nr:c-type cytochrome [Marinobacter sediminum]MCM0613031.1 c-type cytochrome [Marinobacter sediminum]